MPPITELSRPQGLRDQCCHVFPTCFHVYIFGGRWWPQRSDDEEPGAQTAGRELKVWTDWALESG